MCVSRSLLMSALPGTSSSYTPAEQLEKEKEEEVLEVFDTHSHSHSVPECVLYVCVLARGEILTFARQTPDG